MFGPFGDTDAWESGDTEPFSDLPFFRLKLLVFRDPSERYLGGPDWPLVVWFAVGWCGIVVR